MVNVNIGQIIKKESIIEGHKKDGAKWVLAEVKAETGYDKIKVWASNPDEVKKDKDYTIAEISSAKITNKKYEKDGVEKWATEFHINAKLKAVETHEGFQQITDEDIPF